MDYSNGRIQGAGNLKVRKRYFDVHKRYFYGVYPPLQLLVWKYSCVRLLCKIILGSDIYHKVVYCKKNIASSL